MCAFSDYVTASRQFSDWLKEFLEAGNSLPRSNREPPFDGARELLLWLINTQPLTYEDEAHGDGSTEAGLAEDLDQQLSLLGYMPEDLPEWLEWRREMQQNCETTS